MTNEASTSLRTHGLLSNNVYDILKYVVTIVLPAAAVFYINLAPVWDFPRAEAVATTIGTVNVFLGVLLRLSTKSYNNAPVQYDGTFSIEPIPDEPENAMLRLKSIEPDALDPKSAKSQLLFKVVKSVE